MAIHMHKRTVASTLLAFILLLTMAERGSIAEGFDLSTVMISNTVAADDSSEGETPNSEATQKKKGSGFARALGAPFRALGRLFGGNKKNDQQARRMSEKDAKKFESTKITRVKDSRVEPPPTTESNTDPTVAAPTEFDSHLEKGRELLVAGDVNAAIGELSIAASINSKSGEVNKLLAIAYESKGLRDRALQSFELALHSDEKNAEHLNNLGYLLYKNGDYERATKYLKRAAKISPNDARIWNNLALTQCQRGKFEDAYTSFVRAVGEFSAHSNLAGQLQARGYAKDAIKHLEIAQALNPNSVDVLTKLVSLYELTGRPTDAETTRRSLVALKTFADAKK